MSWVYFMGARDGSKIKVGHTKKDLRQRLRQNENHMIGDTEGLCILAAVIGTRTHEQQVLQYFQPDALTGEREWFHPSPRLIEYINWLRQQWWTTLDSGDVISEAVDWDRWMPMADRTVEPVREYGQMALIQGQGELIGTRWDVLSTPEPTGDDFYTPPDLIAAAEAAMGGIDLDPASHWRANRIFHIPTYYHLYRSAFDNPWFGRVWLNPPYGDNEPWLERIIEFWDKGEMQQMCMLSGVWAFTTQMARPVLERSTAMLLLSPTPTFWGHPRGNTGTNRPHAILYMGPRVNEFHDAFAPFGIPCELRLR